MRRRTAVCTAGTVLLGSILLSGCGLPPEKIPEEAGLSGAQQIVCARTIVEGDVLDAHPAETRNRLVVTLSVADWIKPTHGGSTVSVDIVDPAADHGKRYAEGEHVLMIVPKAHDAGAIALRGDDLRRYRAALPRDLRRAENAKCPEWASRR